MGRVKCKPPIAQWVEIPCRFFITAVNQMAFDEAVRRIPGEVFMSMLSPGCFEIQSAAAKNGKD